MFVCVNEVGVAIEVRLNGPAPLLINVTFVPELVLPTAWKG